MSELKTQKEISISRKRVGFVGVGWIGRRRLQSLARSGLIEISAIADPAEVCAREAAACAPGAWICGAMDNLLDCKLDAVVIATPSALHAQQALAALEAGLAVFCQKPLGRTAEETRSVVDAARRSDRLLGIDLCYRQVAGMKMIRRLIREGDIGDIFSVNLVFHNAYGPDKAWFYDARQSGGGCMIDLGIHLVDLALWVLDFPRVTRISGNLFSGGRPIAGRGDCTEDYGVGTFTLGSSAVANLACSWRLSAGCDAVIEATFYGTRGALSLRNVNGSFYDFTAERFRGTSRELLAGPPDDWGGRAAVEWARRLGASGRFDAEVETIMEVASVLDAIYDSA